MYGNVPKRSEKVQKGPERTGKVKLASPCPLLVWRVFIVRIDPKTADVTRI